MYAKIFALKLKFIFKNLILLRIFLISMIIPGIKNIFLIDWYFSFFNF